MAVNRVPVLKEMQISWSGSDLFRNMIRNLTEN